MDRSGTPAAGEVGRLRAFTVGVGKFTSTNPRFEDLDFVSTLVPQVASVLRDIGYDVTEIDAYDLTAERLAAEIDGAFRSAGADDVLVVHIVGHGLAGDGALYVLGSEGTPHPGLDIAHWLVSSQNLPNRPRTLFLLDLCSAGTVARLPWQDAVPTETARGWVIAACQPDGAAYDGRFTEALVNVLRDLDDSAFDIAPTAEHVPLTVVARAIRQETNRLAEAADSFSQTVTASLVDLSAALELPFFPNRAHGTDQRAGLRMALNPGLLPFLDELDEGLDARHFLDRASGVGLRTDELIGCFSGRREQLRRLSPWINGHSDGSTCVVTGSPGVGKSALIGLLVCAAHKELRAATNPIWSGVDPLPYPVNALAAVHARARSVEAVGRSVVAQLGLPRDTGVGDLPGVLAEHFPPPVVVVDALDEADDPVAVLEDLLLPLARARRADGRAAVRLMVGVRPYDELRALQNEADLVVDLDDVDDDVLENDLFRYVSELLRADPDFRHAGAEIGAFATEVARRLSAPSDSPADWGAFLVAGLYTRHLLHLHPSAEGLDWATARNLGQAIPRDLPSVLELDLGDRDQRSLRPVLAAVARAQGEGMPLSVIARLADRLAPESVTLSEVKDALAYAKFYLRQSTDADRTTVYRLFHQGLTDHLVANPTGPGGAPPPADAVLEAMLAPLGHRAARDWAAAEPYVLRNVLAEATRAGLDERVLGDESFLLLPEVPALVRQQLPADHPVAAFVNEFHSGELPRTREALALAAVRAGMAQLAPAVAWRPRWVLSDLSTTANHRQRTRFLVPPDDLDPTGIASRVAVSANGATAAFTDHDGVVMLWKSGDGVGPYAPAARWPLRLSLNADGSMLVVSTQSATPVVHDLVKAVPFDESADVSATATAVSIDPAGTASAWIDAGGELRLVRYGPAKIGSGSTSTQVVAQVADIAWPVEDMPVVVVASDDGLVFWDTAKRGLNGKITHDSPITRISVSLDARTVAYLDQDGRVTVRHSGVAVTIPPTGDAITCLALSPNGRRLVLGRTSGQVECFDAHSATKLGADQPHKAMVGHVATDDEAEVVLSSGTDGSVHLWRRKRDTASLTAFGVTRSTPYLHHRVFVGLVDEPVVVDRVRVALDEVDVLVAGDADGRWARVDLVSGRLLGVIGDRGAPISLINEVEVGGDRLLGVFYEDSALLAWDATTGEIIPGHRWGGFPTPLQVRTITRTARHMGELVEAVPGAGGTVLLRAVRTGDTAATLPGGHDGDVTVVRTGVLRDRPVVMSGGEDGTVRIWALERGVGVPEVIPVFASVFALGTTTSGALLVGAGGEVIAFERTGGIG